MEKEEGKKVVEDTACQQEEEEALQKAQEQTAP